MGTMADDIRRLLPVAGPLDDDAIVEAYGWPETDRPGVRVNFVTSVDGAVTIDGYSAGLGSPADKRVFDLLRMTCDALLVGAGTLRQEGYGPMRLPEPHRQWRTERGRTADPVLVVVSGRLDLDPADPMLADAPQRPVIVTHGGSPADRRRRLSAVADVLVRGDTTIDLPAAVGALIDRGHRRLLCEGGPHLLGALTGADLVAELCLTVAPTLAGAGAGRITAGPVSAARDLTLVHALTSGDDLLLRYARRDRFALDTHTHHP